MSSEIDRIDRILKRAVELTRSRQLEWDAGERLYGYYAPVPGGILFVGSADGDGVGPWEFAVLSPEGRAVDELRTDHRPETFEAVHGLYDTAQKRVEGTEGVLDDVERGLGL